MKKLIFVAITLCSVLLVSNTNAQVSVHFNIGVQPLWGPVGYDYVEYYYIPDIDAYYDVDAQMYVYYVDGRWENHRELPPRYRNFDLYHAHKVVINERSPWIHHDRYRTRYARYRGHYDQPVIRNSREERYWANPEHPHHNEWHGQNGPRGDHGHYDNGNHGHGHDNGHGHGHGNNHR